VGEAIVDSLNLYTTSKEDLQALGMSQLCKQKIISIVSFLLKRKWFFALTTQV
jgi:hypothetical protein